MQRDCEFEVFDVDKSGGFIGGLYLNKTENAAIALVREGLATVHSYSADTLPWAKQLYDAEVFILHLGCFGSILIANTYIRRKPRKRSARYIIILANILVD